MNRTTNLLTVRIQSVSKYPDVDLKKKKKKNVAREWTYLHRHAWICLGTYVFLFKNGFPRG